MTNINKYSIYIISIFLLLLPGPLYWTASLSKEHLYYIFLSGVFYFLLSIKKYISKRQIILSLSASIFSRFNIIAIVFFSKIFFLFKTDSKINFIKNLIKIYLFIIILFIVGILFLDIKFGINFFESPMYIPFGFDAKETWGYKMDFVPMNIQELFYKLPIKYLLTIFSEVNIIHLFSFPYGNTNSYAIVFNTVEGLIRSVFIMLVLINFCIKKNIDYIAYKFIGLTLIFWLLFAISIGFFQSRYLIFGDYLLIFSYIFLKSNRRRYR